MIQRFEDHLSLSALPDVVYYDDPRYKILRRALHSSRTPREYSAGFLPIFPANFQRYSFYVSNDSLVTSYAEFRCFLSFQLFFLSFFFFKFNNFLSFNSKIICYNGFIINNWRTYTKIIIIRY